MSVDKRPDIEMDPSAKNILGVGRPTEVPYTVAHDLYGFGSDSLLNRVIALTGAITDQTSEDSDMRTLKSLAGGIPEAERAVNDIFTALDGLSEAIASFRQQTG